MGAPPPPHLRLTLIVRRTEPRAARIAARLAIALFLVPLLPELFRFVPPESWLSQALQSQVFKWGPWLAAAAASALATLLLSRGIARAASVALDARSLYITTRLRERRIPLGTIVNASVRPLTAGEVELDLANGRSFHLHIGDAKNAQRFVDALALSPDKLRATIVMGTPARALGHYIAALMFAVTVPSLAFEIVGLDLGKAITANIVPIWLGSAVIALWVARLPEITVGDDGLVIERPWGRRFIPYARVLRVSVADADIYIMLHSGDHVRIGGSSLSAARAVHARATVAMKRAAEREDPHPAGWLERRGRTFANWRASVVAGLRPASSYRVPAHEPDDALRVLRDPAAPAEQRIGAALALIGSRQQGAADKVRIAADACANDRLRIALTQAATDEPDDAAIEAALAEEEARSHDAAPAAR